MTQRIGILGGTFDPIHFGHLAIAEEARTGLNLDRVLLIPAGHQPFKGGAHAATPRQRLEMARLACQENPAFEVSPIEIERPGPSYTALTLEQLHSTLPAEWYFILGADALADFPRWYSIQRVIELARIVAVTRPGYQVDSTALYAALPQLADRLRFLEGPRLEIASSDLRHRIACGHPIRYQTPDSVIAYIRAQQLYIN